MAYRIRRAEYFYVVINDQPGEAYQFLFQLAHWGINLLAFTGVPIGPHRTQLTLFPEDPAAMKDEAKRTGLSLDGPHPALLVQGDDELGALAKIHKELFEAHVSVFASTGVADGGGSYGYILYVRPEEYNKAVEALGL